MRLSSHEVLSLAKNWHRSPVTKKFLSELRQESEKRRGMGPWKCQSLEGVVKNTEPLTFAQACREPQRAGVQDHL